jgi:hypothetical protein
LYLNNTALQKNELLVAGHPSRRPFAPPDKAFSFKELPHPEGARRAVSKGASEESRIFAAICQLLLGLL